MIDLSKYTLRYYEIGTNKIYYGRKPDSITYKIYDPMTGEVETLNRHAFGKRFKSCDHNKKVRSEIFRKSKAVMAC
jgi:hypothetical protein